MESLEKYLEKLSQGEPGRVNILLNYLKEKPLEDWIEVFEMLIEKKGCEREVCYFVIQDFLEIFKKYLMEEKKAFQEAKVQIENALYIYYFFNKLYELLWRVKNLEEFLKEIPFQLDLIPFIKDIAYVFEGKEVCSLEKEKGLFKIWLEQYLSLENPPESPLLLEESEILESLKYIFEEGKFSILLIPIEISVKDYQGIFYLAFKITRRAYSEWEKILMLEELPQILKFLFKIVSEKEEETLFFDNLTGLPRQSFFLFQVEKFIERAQRSQRPLLVAIADIDKFTVINQVFGYDIGDEVLVEVAKRLKDLIKDGEIARGRGSGFNFALMTVEPYEFLKRCKELLSKPIYTDKGIIEITLSIGGSLFPDHGDDPKMLLRCAETALKTAKKEGGNTVYLFKKEILGKAEEYVKLLPRLKRALKEKHFVIYCQPRIDLKSKKVIGGEALVRWLDPEEGIIPPGKFIWVMEESGLIKELGYWIIEETCKLIKNFEEEKDFYLALDISLNLSPQQLKETDLVKNLQKIFESYSVCPSKLTIEITENIFVEDTLEISEQIKKLAEMGIKIALDDFGTGYSSFRYLSTLPFNDLKVDLIFVQNMLNSYADLEIVKTIVALGKILKKKVIAEGVETREQLKELMFLGVDEAQGYLFSPPLPWTKFLEFVKTFDPANYFSF